MTPERITALTLIQSRATQARTSLRAMQLELSHVGDKLPEESRVAFQYAADNLDAHLDKIVELAREASH